MRVLLGWLLMLGGFVAVAAGVSSAPAVGWWLVAGGLVAFAAGWWLEDAHLSGDLLGDHPEEGRED